MAERETTSLIEPMLWAAVRATVPRLLVVASEIAEMASSTDRIRFWMPAWNWPTTASARDPMLSAAKRTDPCTRPTVSEIESTLSAVVRAFAIALRTMVSEMALKLSAAVRAFAIPLRTIVSVSDPRESAAVRVLAMALRATVSEIAPTV